MALDFTVIIQTRQRFGDDKQDDFAQETEAPFVGHQKDFAFQCPNVDRNQQAILLFQSMGVDIPQSLEINGQQIFGGIPSSTYVLPILVGPARTAAQWNGNVMLVHPGVLQENNVLRIQSRALSGGNIDNFIIDNLVVVFKTR